MRIAIVGGGGVGGYIGAKLAQVADVDIISSSLERVCIKEEKLNCYDIPIYKTPPPKIYDLVIFAVKSYALDEAINKMKKSIGPDTIVLPLLNGIEPYEKLKKVFPNTYKGAIYVIANKKDGVIEVKGKGAMVVTEFDENLKKLFKKAGIKVKMPSDIDKAIWQKYLFIAATAALTSFYKKSFGEIAKEHKEEFLELLDEIIAIAQKEGVNLTQEDKQKALMLLEKSPPQAKTSMQLDFEKSHPTEIENILGYLAKKGAKKIEAIYSHLSKKLPSSS